MGADAADRSAWPPALMRSDVLCESTECDFRAVLRPNRLIAQASEVDARLPRNHQAYGTLGVLTRGQRELLSQPPSDGARRCHETYGSAANRMRGTLLPEGYTIGRSLNRKNCTVLYKGYDLSVRIADRSSHGPLSLAAETAAIRAHASSNTRLTITSC